MDTISLRFALRLTDTTDPQEPAGPLFHKWMPDGERDALLLTPSECPYTIRVWTERHGFLDEFGRFQFEAERTGLTDDELRTQQRLDAGHLHGQADGMEVTVEEMEMLECDRRGDEYQALGKKLLRLVLPPVQKLTRAMRYRYGQWWIEAPVAWDSRFLTLGEYCAAMQMRWRSSQDGSWRPFWPNDPRQIIRGTIRVTAAGAYEALLTKDDWVELPAVMTDEDKSLMASMSMVAVAQRAVRLRRLLEGYVFAAAACELALEHFVAVRFTTDDKQWAMQFWASDRFHARLSVVLPMLSSCDRPLIDLCNKAIKTRNAIVHEGAPLPADAEQQVAGLLRVVALLVGDVTKKLPDSL